MSLTRQDIQWHAVYAAATTDLTTVIDGAFNAAKDAIITDSTIKLDWCRSDGAECLVAAITRFVCESNPEHPDVIASLRAMAVEEART